MLTRCSFHNVYTVLIIICGLIGFCSALILISIQQGIRPKYGITNKILWCVIGGAATAAFFDRCDA